MNEISTAGATVKYAIETTAGTRPVSGYKAIPNIKSIPDLNPEPSSLEVTDLSDTEYKRYISGLKDPGGAVSFNANNTNEFQTTWGTMVEAAQEAEASGKSCWIEIAIPGLENAFYFAGKPASLGLGAAEVDSVAEIEARITPSLIAGWATKSTN